MKKSSLITVMIIIIVLAAGFSFLFFYPKRENNTMLQNEVGQGKAEPDIYLSITYTTTDDSAERGRIMNFYTYDLATGELENQAQIPFSSQYALGAVSLSDHKVYYSSSAAEGGGGMRNAVDHLYEYNMLDGTSSVLETENCAYNDIIPVDGKLLVTSVPAHAIGTGTFDLENKTFSYLYEQSLNEDGYIDFPYSTIPVDLNYNYKYGNFVNVYALESDLYDYEVRTGKKPLDYRVALVDADLNIKSEYVFTLEAYIDEEVTAAAQTSSDRAILLETVDLDTYYDGDDWLDKDFEQEYRFYEIDFSRQSCKKIESPFPGMSSVGNFITVDDGKSYYVSGKNMEGDSGLFYYDCLNNEVTPVLLDDYGENYEIDNHVVNFCLIKK